MTDHELNIELQKVLRYLMTAALAKKSLGQTQVLIREHDIAWRAAVGKVILEDSFLFPEDHADIIKVLRLSVAFQIAVTCHQDGEAIREFLIKYNKPKWWQKRHKRGQLIQHR